MGLQCGIVGLPNVGKSTLFNCLSNAKAQSANFPFCTIEPNIGVITVPDKRLFELEKIVKPEKVIPANIEILDIAGLVKGASKGEGLGNKFLSNIRQTDAIIHVLRCFEDKNITHINSKIDPVSDKEIIDIELQLKDLEKIENSIEKTNKLIKIGDKKAKIFLEILNNCKEHLEKGNSIREISLEKKEKILLKDLYLLTDKPILYVCNVDENSASNGNKYVESLKKSVENENAEVLIISAAIEADIAELESFEERSLFLEELGLKEVGVVKLIQSAYKLLNLKTFFTAGKKEVKAWTFKKGMFAPETAGIIHSDFEKGFIRAEVIKYPDYMRYSSESKCRDAGKIASEGKKYIVKDGDIMHFLFNV